jgi:hypothetical protein
MQSLEIGAGVFIVILVGTFVGWLAGQRLQHHVTEETKFVINMASGVVATVAAISLGLLLSSSNATYTSRTNDVTRLSAEIIRLDRLLARYGADADPARETLRQFAERKAADLFPEDQRASPRMQNEATYDVFFQAEEQILALPTDNPLNQWIVNQAMTLASDIGNTRWLLAQQESQWMPPAFLVLLTFWLTLLFASFGLFAPRKAISAVALVLCALAVSGAIEMILDLQHPFSGINRTSPQPMRNAVNTLNESVGKALSEHAGDGRYPAGSALSLTLRIGEPHPLIRSRGTAQMKLGDVERLRWQWISTRFHVEMSMSYLTSAESRAEINCAPAREWLTTLTRWRQELDELLERYPLEQPSRQPVKRAKKRLAESRCVLRTKRINST